MSVPEGDLTGWDIDYTTTHLDYANPDPPSIRFVKGELEVRVQVSRRKVMEAVGYPDAVRGYIYLETEREDPDVYEEVEKAFGIPLENRCPGKKGLWIVPLPGEKTAMEKWQLGIPPVPK